MMEYDLIADVFVQCRECKKKFPTIEGCALHWEVFHRRKEQKESKEEGNIEAWKEREIEENNRKKGNR